MDWGDCYYSMITPLLRTPILGAIWYQGETDTTVGGSSVPQRAANYNCTFRAMLTDWRAKFHAASHGATAADFPFGITQLAPWAAGGGSKDDNDACGQSKDCPVATVRWGQSANVGNVLNSSLLPNTFMAVTVDLADWDSPYGSIHPRHKIPVGDRLAAGALSVAYGGNEYWTGPISPVASTTARGVRVQFSNCAPGGISLHATTGFEVRGAGDTALWRPAAVVPDAATQAKCAVDLDAAASKGAREVRYNWFRVTCFANGKSSLLVCFAEV